MTVAYESKSAKNLTHGDIVYVSGELGRHRAPKHYDAPAMAFVQEVTYTYEQNVKLMFTGGETMIVHPDTQVKVVMQ
jgi:hypothetical protein